MNPTPLSSGVDQIGAAIGRLPSGCHILTVARRGQSTGVLVSWVQQAAFDPPSISVCLRRGRPVQVLLEESGRFLLNVLGENVTEMMRHFGRGFSLEEDAFRGLDVFATPFGPGLGRCAAQLGCELSGSLPVGDHVLYVARVAAGAADGQNPYVHLRRNGLSY